MHRGRRERQVAQLVDDQQLRLGVERQAVLQPALGMRREVRARRTGAAGRLLSCGRCGRRLAVAYTGRPPGQPVYRCDRPNQMLGLPRCFTFGGLRVDAAIARELLRAVEPLAIEAAVEPRRKPVESEDETTADRRTRAAAGPV